MGPQDISKDGVSSDVMSRLQWSALNSGCSIFVATHWQVGSRDIADSLASRGVCEGAWQCSQLSELDWQASAWKRSKQELWGQTWSTAWWLLSFGAMEKMFVLFKIRELKYFKIYSCFNPQECLMQNHIEIKTTLLDGRCFFWMENCPIVLLKFSFQYLIPFMTIATDWNLECLRVCQFFVSAT